MGRDRKRDTEYRPSPLSKQLSNTNFPDSGIGGENFDPQPNICACSPQACNILTGNFLDHDSIYIHYLAMMQSNSISGPSELQSILAGGGGKPELTAQLKVSPSRWLHLGWLKENAIPDGNVDKQGQGSLIACGNIASKSIIDSGASLNGNTQHATERRKSSEVDPDDEMDRGLLGRQHTYHNMAPTNAYGVYSGGPRGFPMNDDDFSDFEETHGVDYYWYSRQHGARG